MASNNNNGSLWADLAKQITETAGALAQAYVTSKYQPYEKTANGVVQSGKTADVSISSALSEGFTVKPVHVVLFGGLALGLFLLLR